MEYDEVKPISLKWDNKISSEAEVVNLMIASVFVLKERGINGGIKKSLKIIFNRFTIYIKPVKDSSHE